MIELPGQPLASRVLSAAVARESPPQQLLLHGPPGSGKRAAARRVAWAIIDPEGAHPAEAVGLDLSVIEATGTQIRVDADLAPALSDLSARPVVGRRRVLIIVGAERLTDHEGAPRILKALEEPPPRSHLILVTDRLEDVIVTVRSRCLPVPFRTPGWRAIRDRLVERGMDPVEAESRARADGTLALEAGPFELRMRTLGIELGRGALAGRRSGAEVVRSVQGEMERAASEHPSPELARLRAEAGALAGRRGERTAIKRAEDQEKRERRRAVTDGWAHVLDGAAALVADALALAVGSDRVVRHPALVDELRPLAGADRAPFLVRVLDEIQRTRSELLLNPTNDLAAEALLARVHLARLGEPVRLRDPGRLPA